MEILSALLPFGYGNSAAPGDCQHKDILKQSMDGFFAVNLDKMLHNSTVTGELRSLSPFIKFKILNLNLWHHCNEWLGMCICCVSLSS